MKDLISLLENIGKLKTLQRQGFVVNSVPHPESVADHSFRVAVMALLLSEKRNLDVNKCIRLALIHDIPEALAGDITPYDQVSPQEQHEIEKQALHELFKDFQSPEVIQLWEEFEARTTKEAKFVYELEKIEVLLQAYEYEKQYEGMKLDDFFEHVKTRVHDPELVAMYTFLVKNRKQ